jgi:hypothetical protein
MDNKQIYELINAGKHGEANKAILDRLMASGARDAVAQAAMWYAYDHGHASGEGEVCRIAMGLLTEVFEAK